MPLIDDLFSLAGRVALVTGASSGIGRHAAETLARAGASVVLAARRRAELEATREAIAGAGGRAAVVECDLAVREAVRACAKSAGVAFGPPDILVCAAGVNLRRPILEVRDEDWDRTLAVNLDAPFFLAQSLAPAMIERRWGRIVNIASLQSVRAFADSASYGASKGGIAQLTRAQAEAWTRYGVTANAIAPGFFETPLTAPVFGDPKRSQAMAARTFAGRNGRMPDLAGALVFLSSEASAYVAGQVLFVDGGFSAN